MQTDSEDPVRSLAIVVKALCEAMEGAKNASNSVVIDTLYGLVAEAFCNYTEMATTALTKTSLYAYHARNILELLVWVRYCIADPQNAVRFNEDASRDMEGLRAALKKMTAPLGQTPGALEAVRWIEPKDVEHVRDLLGKESGDTNYKHVADAVTKHGAGNFLVYEALYKLFSKLAHPTALIIKGDFRGEGGKPVSEDCLYLTTQLMGELVLEIAGYLQPTLAINTAKADFHAAIHDLLRKERTKAKEA